MTTVRDRAARRPHGATTARRSVGLGLVEILSWMRHCVLRPLLFVRFINDMPDVVTFPVHVFEDNTKLYRRVTTIEDHQALQADLTSLEDWTEKEGNWNMLTENIVTFGTIYKYLQKPLRSGMFTNLNKAMIIHTHACVCAYCMYVRICMYVCM